jgi:hypothetical protein
MHRVTRRPEIEDALNHITKIRSVLATSTNPLQIELGYFMIDMRLADIRDLEHQNDNIIPLRRA